jgi:hypothetical protein
MTWLLSLLADMFGVFLKSRESTEEKLGAAEVKGDDALATAEALQREAVAATDAPTSKTAMERLLQDGKLSIAFLCLFLASCADHGVAYPCISVKAWSVVEQQNMKADLETLPSDSPLVGAMIDYARMRAQARAYDE